MQQIAHRSYDRLGSSMSDQGGVFPFAIHLTVTNRIAQLADHDVRTGYRNPPSGSRPNVVFE
jgi:hypothetical protein